VHRSIELYEAVFRSYTGLRWSEVRDRAGAFAAWFDDTDVQLLPELEGIAEGAGVTAEDVLALNVRTEVMFGLDARAGRAAAKECTAIGAAPPATRDGHVFVAQNWDWKPPTRETCVLLAMRPTGRPSFVTLVEAGLLAKAGMNDAGIALATNALTSSLDRGQAGVPYHAVLRRILSSRTLDEAVSEVRDRARASSANYLLGDRTGRLVDLEVAPGGPGETWRTEGDTLCHANHFERPDRPFKDLALLEGRESPMRRERAWGSLGDGPIDGSAIEGALRRHATDRGDGSVCAHGDPSLPPEDDYVTIASIILDPVAGELHISHGNPCEAPFESLRLADLVGA
jgi:isopenicillin-N N-acyltransferase-like protein